MDVKIDVFVCLIFIIYEPINQRIVSREAINRRDGKKFEMTGSIASQRKLQILFYHGYQT